MATIRENFQDREKGFISPWGCLSAESRGRSRPEPECHIRTPFQRDRDRIVYSNAFRRLKYKTQVFLTPLGLGDHYRTRLTHTLEVAEISRAISRAMRLNEDLAEAIALAHDLGHTPFGHSGETVLKEIFSRAFTHQAQSLRVVDFLENNGRGLNLSEEVRDGILKHSKGYGKIMPEDPDRLPHTMEGRVVRFADIMAYLNHDLDDAIRSRIITREEVPEKCLKVIGESHSERATRMISDLINTTQEKEGGLELRMSEDMFDAMITLRKFLYARVYRAPQVHAAFVKAKKILADLYQYFMANEAPLRSELAEMEMDRCHPEGVPLEQVVCDCIASMTDQRALGVYEKLFFPAPSGKRLLQ